LLQEKAVEATKQKEEGKTKPKTEEQEGKPQHQHCPPEKRLLCWSPPATKEKNIQPQLSLYLFVCLSISLKD
jgi:hypothetical protein